MVIAVVDLDGTLLAYIACRMQPSSALMWLSEKRAT